MRALVQRVSFAAVDVRGECIAQIGVGLLILLGIQQGDGEEQARVLAKKVVEMRIFSDDQGKMNRSVVDEKGAILVVSQFTLYGDTSKGRRPNFMRAARPDEALPLYEMFIKNVKTYGVNVQQGRFGAMMDVRSTNDGPVTLIVDCD